MLGSIISGLVQGFISGILKPILAYFQRRQDIATGKLEQHSADQDSAIQDARNAVKAENQANASSDAELDARLERLRHESTGH